MQSRFFCRPITGIVLSALAQGCHSQSVPAAPTHIISKFHFSIAAPFERVAPQFGPKAELAWGDPQWTPHFVYPQPGKDIAGAVFTVPHGDSNSIWVNTNYDPVGGHMQYVYVIAEAMVCVIDVHVIPSDRSHTEVEVTYTRTALKPEHNEGVSHLAQKDAQSGPEWQRYVEHALGMDRP